jgi:dual 3',5'-cyclic-AMP and -GMP phosphodiesterase 11
VVDAWLITHATSSSATTSSSGDSPTQAGGSSRGGSGATTPVRKISAHEFERGGLLKPIVTTIDGTPTFLVTGPGSQESTTTNCSSHQLLAGSGGNNSMAPGGGGGSGQRRSRNELRLLDEKELIFELVKDICNELDVRSLCHKILQNVSTLLRADRSSLFLVQGNSCAPPSNRCLVSKLFDVCSRSTLEEMEKKDEIKIQWGHGIVGFVAQSGVPVNIPDAYKVCVLLSFRFYFFLPR